MASMAFYLLAGTLTTLLLVGGAALVGPAAIFLNLFAPLPAALVFLRKGLLAGTGIVFFAATIFGMSEGGSGVLAYLLQFGVASLVLPLLLRMGWAWDRATLGTLVVVLGLAGMALWGYAQQSGVEVPQLVQGYVAAEMDRVLVLYQQAELPAEQLQELQAVARQMGDFMSRTWPGLAVLFAGIMLLINVVMLVRLSRGTYVVPGPSFAGWKVPEWLVWPLIAGGFGAFFTQGGWQVAAINVLVVTVPLYFLQGLAIVNFFFRERRTPPLLRTLGYVLMLLLNPLPLIVTGIGVFDLWADFRKPRIKRN